MATTALCELELPVLERLEGIVKRARGKLKGARRVVGAALGSLDSLSIAWLAQRRDATLLAVTPDEDEARALAADLASLLGDDAVSLNPPLDYGGDAARALDGWGSLGDRIALLRAEHQGPGVVVSSIASLMERVPHPDFLSDSSLQVEVGAELDLGVWVRTLASRGHRRVTLVESPGEFALRGGILDVFPVGQALPLRIELFGDEVEEIRRFDPTDQRSIARLPRASVLAASVGDYMRARRRDDALCLAERLPGARAGGMVLLVNREALLARAQKVWDKGREGDLLSVEDVFERFGGRPVLELERWTVDDPEARVVDLGARPHGIEASSLADLARELIARLQSGDAVRILVQSEDDEKRLRAMLASGDERLPDYPGLAFLQLDLGRGFRLPEAQLTVLTAAEVFHRVRVGRRKVSSREEHRGREISSLGDLTVGSPVVHVVHGIGLFRGVKVLEQDGQPRDNLVIEYRDTALLYVPVDRIGLVRHYIGSGDSPPTLSKLGGSAWQNRKRKAAEACEDLAAELLEIQAARELQPGVAYPPDDDDMMAFEAAFPFEETVDQQRAIDEVKADLERAQPMDRLVCGDVGFGKTEVAMRAAMKVALSGRQVAVLAPTTILAHQHYKTFTSRAAQTPVVIDVVSRFRAKKDQREVIKRLKQGGVDILIGTHRLLSKDVKFKDLGLAIIDEEQRFGVAHKETLKALRRSVEVLTLTATPIPRTLHMALSGARDISVIASPPRGRIPVRSQVTRFNEALIEQSIRDELGRGGQVYIVHDRVSTILELAGLVMRLVPEAKVGVVHGQLEDELIEDTMLGFMEGSVDVLVATKIIENGLDVPRANTLIVNRADRFGLAELHQIRGRVGRHRTQAFAWFLLPRHGVISSVAEKRLRAIEEHTDLGAGFRIALRDLEIRGAGNMLGAQQSGHIADVGYDLYCRLLRKAVNDLRARRARGEAIPKRRKRPPQMAPRKRDETPTGPKAPGRGGLEGADLELETGAVELGFRVPTLIPDAYIDDTALKIEIYRKLSSSDNLNELEALAEELRDRFGEMPEDLRMLFGLRALRHLAVLAGVSRMHRQDKVVVIEYADRQLLQAALYAFRSRLRVLEDKPNIAHFVLDDPDAEDKDVIAALLEAFSAVDREGALRERRRFGKVSTPRKRRRKKRGKAWPSSKSKA